MKRKSTSTDITSETTIGGKIMKNLYSIVNTTETKKVNTMTTAKEANNMKENNFIPMMVKSINFGITSNDITKFFYLSSEEIAPALDSYYTKHKIYAERAIAQLIANNKRAAEASETRKRASYSEDLTEAMLFLIKHGATIEDLSRCFNIKRENTVKKWLLERWPKVGKKHYALFLENGNPNSVEAPVLPEEEITFESWYGSEPDVDCIISRYMDPTLTEIAKDYCEQNGLSYIVAKACSYITAQSAAMGRPTVISDSLDLKPICEEDAIPFIFANDLFKKVTNFENKDIKFASTIDFNAFTKSKTGVYSCAKNNLIAELKSYFYPNAAYSIFLSKKDKSYKEAPERFGLREGHTFIIIAVEDSSVYAWKYQLSAGHFHEVNYASGPKSTLLYIMDRLA